MLTKEKFEALANFHNDPCVTILIPTMRAGQDVLEGKDIIQLKTQWKNAKKELTAREVDTDKINEFDKAIEALIDDKNFWRHQKDGLAVFLAPGFSEHYSLPVSFEPTTYVSDHFYLKPLVAGISDNSEFYLLSVQMQEVKFFRANRHHIEAIDIAELVPERLEDRVGYDYEEKQLGRVESRVGNTDTHGFNVADRDRKSEVFRFYRAVNDGIIEKINGEETPLVVASDEAYFPVYQKANTYNHLIPEPVSGNPNDYRNVEALHQAALKVMEPFFEKEKQEKLHKFRELNKTEKSSTSIDEIIPAIFEGKVDTLFVREGEDVWGRYNENMASVEIHNGPDHTNQSLLNLAAVKVIEQGGTVYVMKDGFLPDNNAQLNALYRY